MHAHARAREIIELFCPRQPKWAISPLVAATISDCRAAPEVSEPRSCPAFASALTLARAHLNATCHVIYLSDNFSVAKGLMVVASALTLARAHLNATCHVIYLSDNFSVAKGLIWSSPAVGMDQTGWHI